MSKATRNKSARERLREERRRQASRQRVIRRLGLAGGAVAIIIIVVVVAIVVQTQRHQGSGQAFHGKLPAAKVLSDGGIQVAKAGVEGPTLNIWEDFQCPVCEHFETVNNVTVKKLIAHGKVRVIYHPVRVIDERSVRAGAAAYCAAYDGKFVPYHDLLYANQQPESSGKGFGIAELQGFGKKVGITDPSFAKCVSSQKYAGRILKSTQHAQHMRGFGGTPTLYLNGKVLGRGAVFSADGLRNAVQQAASS